MKCPHCQTEIADTRIAAHFASIGGKKSKRAITKEQQQKMQESRAQNRERARIAALQLPKNANTVTYAETLEKKSTATSKEERGNVDHVVGNVNTGSDFVSHAGKPECSNRQEN